ncbi:MAG: UpxY family transcription antiterminator [Prevotellaceae bacterium]|nr:UpxY family transcription antiterminator [Prevotellaceae bacterium]
MTSENDKNKQWFVMRDLKRTNAKQPAYRLLAEQQIEVFTPMKWTLVTSRGKKVRKEVPFLQDLVFVHDTREKIDPIVAKCPTLQYRFLRKTYRKPMTVPTSEMERFIHAVISSESPRYYLPEEITPEMYRRKIRIVGGPLDGYEGSLLTMRGSKVKRLLVELPNLLTAGVEVSPEYIQIVN